MARWQVSRRKGIYKDYKRFWLFQALNVPLFHIRAERYSPGSLTLPFFSVYTVLGLAEATTISCSSPHRVSKMDCIVSVGHAYIILHTRRNRCDKLQQGSPFVGGVNSSRHNHTRGLFSNTSRRQGLRLISIHKIERQSSCHDPIHICLTVVIKRNLEFI